MLNLLSPLLKKRARPLAPTTRDEARDRLSELGVVIAERERIHAEAKQATEAIWQEANEQIAKLDKRAFAFGRALYRFWRTSGRALTDNKTLKLDEAGNLKEWTRTGPLVFDEARLLRLLKESGRDDLIKTVETVDVELLGNESKNSLRKLGVKRRRYTKFYATTTGTVHRVERDPKRKGLWLLAIPK